MMDNFLMHFDEDQLINELPAPPYFHVFHNECVLVGNRNTLNSRGYMFKDGMTWPLYIPILIHPLNDMSFYYLPPFTGIPTA